jgi:hypothetical protein
MELLSTSLLSVFRGTPNHGLWITACLQGAWPGMVGEKLAAVCRPALLSQAELVVEVLDPDWLPVLSGMKKELLTRIRAFAGDEIQRLTLVNRGSL